MNRIALDSLVGGRRASVGSQLHHLRGGGQDDAADDSLDLFARTRRSDGGAPMISSTATRSDGESTRLERISVGSTRIGKGMEDLFDAEIGKHDYDWLLTPPETPLYPSAVARESPLSSVSRESPLTSAPRESPLSTAVPRGRTNARSVSSTRPSRLSTSQTENSHSSRPVRSSSVTRSSITSTYSSSSFSNNNRTSVLNTSSASVTSSRPSTPGNRSGSSRPSANSISTRPSSTSTIARPSSTSTIARPSSSSTTARPSSTVRSVPSRMPTPTRTRPNPSGTTGDRMARPSNSSRPSTPTSRPQTPSNPIPNPSSRANSRSSTPTRRPTSSTGSSSSASNVGSRFPSAGRISSMNNRNPSAPSSRPSSPGPRPRAPVRPIDVPDFPADAPPNLRTKLPDRPASAGRIRPGMAALTVRANSNSESAAPAVAAQPPSSNRRNYMPVLSRGRFPENPPKILAKVHGNNRLETAGGAAADIQKLAAPDGGLRRPTKPASTTESTGFGRNISKKSLDMALRHMDIRQGMGGIRASSLFPQSIRSTTTKGRLASSKSDPVVPLATDEAMAENGSCTGTISPDCRSSFAHSENGDMTAASKSPDRDSLAARDSELDHLQGSSRYDAFMLKEEDSKSMNWLHSVEDKSDQSPMFDHRFEPLPEPFGLL